jgi:hypothetical protein
MEQNITFICLCLAVFRIYLEVIGFNFGKLPLTAKLPVEKQTHIHKTGFYLSLGYFILFAPSYLLY